MKSKKQIVPSNSDIIVSKIKKGLSTLDELLSLIESLKNTFFDDAFLELELLLSNGLPLEIINDKVFLKTNINSLSEQVFCIVDIETNGSNVKNGQVIEIGAVKLKNGQIIDSYESLVYAKDVPPYIQEVTNITPSMLKDAPVLKTVLEEFKIFLEDDVFVAHDIKFDYRFISESFKKYNLGELQNRKLCTIDLAKRTIEAQRYGLDFLKDLLHINIDTQHRAYSDALSTSYILKESISKLSEKIITAEDLIAFSKSDNIINNKHKQKNKEKEK
ncbi:3'-5' exonuclease [uncultured Arcobacter sp.]|uniref:3'-5' exonuclease n=1 Tax=uncultured Arcobacter sp. TaxID=165434 RepID=UPI0026354772|nr:3'-5' exonuclease [uncultured Arcobacter sp.]